MIHGEAAMWRCGVGSRTPFKNLNQICIKG